MIEREAADVVLRAIEGGFADDLLRAHHARVAEAGTGCLPLLENEFAERMSILIGQGCFVFLRVGGPRPTKEETDVYRALSARYNQVCF